MLCNVLYVVEVRYVRYVGDDMHVCNVHYVCMLCVSVYTYVLYVFVYVIHVSVCMHVMNVCLYEFHVCMSVCA